MNPFYTQRRKGLNGKVFSIYKLRTMKEGSRLAPPANPPAGERASGEVAPGRVTFLGKFLRSYSLDELPQLVNVLKGEMSIVGPRPFSMDVFRRFDTRAQDFIRWTSVRESVRPGMTGLWQISGRKDLRREDVFVLDIAYVESRGLWLDLAILLKTPLAVLKQRGAY